MTHPAALPLSAGERARVRRALAAAVDALLAERHPDGFWPGRLSSSALATATAVSALALAAPGERRLITDGLAWLRRDQNADGGWGDSPASPSNLPTTSLVRAAFRLAGAPPCPRADAYVRRHAGASGAALADALRRLYGNDRTFAVPILVNCALAGGPEEERVAWNHLPALPFELACLPRSALRHLRIQVVSYALPALIALGLLLHQRGRGDPLRRLLRRVACRPALRRLAAMQPSSGGFLEAVPLTAFVVMSLVASGRGRDPVVRRGLDFLRATARPDGSWPIDADLSVWLTSLSVLALARAGRLSAVDARATRDWLLERQHRAAHPYTDAPPGGWAWTHRPGGVPDADDTAAALLALCALELACGAPGGAGPARRAAARGVRWLLALQNRDGGWPTFCRGWGRLPFDRSAPDLTAHALRALHRWRRADSPALRRARAAAQRYLRRVQRADGAWVPLWFGNQSAPAQENPVIGTARVLAAYADLGHRGAAEARRGVAFLLSAQRSDGLWGGAPEATPSVEETALALDGLLPWADDPPVARACCRAAAALADRVQCGALPHAAPIGLYFARLWYAERVYPIVWTVGALGGVLHDLRASGSGGQAP